MPIKTNLCTVKYYDIKLSIYRIDFLSLYAR